MKILNFGSCNVDLVYSLDHIVNIGETETTHKLQTFPGGKGLNQSIALVRAGAEVYHAGCIGTDGDFLIQTLEENGVDTSYIKRVDEKNGHAIIQVSREGENSIFLYPGSNEMISTSHIDSVLEHFASGDMILLQNEINNLDYIIKSAYEKGMKIILNPSPYNQVIKGIDLKMIYCLILNEIEAKDVTGASDTDEALAYFKANYPTLRVMLTLGKKGCVYQDEGCRVFHPIFKVNAVDTTAAGDTFTGYFVAGMAEGQEYGEILRIASCASAIAVSRHGAAPSIPGRSEVLSQVDLLPIDGPNNKMDKIRVKVMRYIDANIQNASLGELAQMLGYSTIYTGNLIKRITGKTFKKLLQDKRLAISAQMLLDTEMSVGEIIKTVGYENENFFRRIFKERYGANPLAFRKREVK